MGLERIDTLLARLSTRRGITRLHAFREAMHLAVLEVIGADKELMNTLTFQGGTALRLCYGLGRLSEDLDFVAGGEGEKVLSAGKRLKALLEQSFPELKIKERQREFLYILRLDIPHERITVKVEIARVPAYTSAFRKVESELFSHLPSIWIRTETKEEVLADKVVAMGLRSFSEERPFKARDVWDIHWLISRKVGVDTSLVLKKVEDYGKSLEDFMNGLRKRIEFMRRGNAYEPFIEEMERFLYGRDYELLSDYPKEIAGAVIGEVSDYLESFLQRSKPDVAPEL